MLFYGLANSGSFQKCSFAGRAHSREEALSLRFDFAKAKRTRKWNEPKVTRRRAPRALRRYCSRPASAASASAWVVQLPAVMASAVAQSTRSS